MTQVFRSPMFLEFQRIKTKFVRALSEDRPEGRGEFWVIFRAEM